MEELLAPLAELAPGRLLEDPRTVDSPIYLVLLGVFVVTFLLGLIISLNPPRLSRGNRLHRRILERYGTLAGWLGMVGIIIIGLRYTNVPLFSKRLWTVLDLLAVVAVGVHFIRYRLRVYPGEIAAYREQERRRRFIPTGGRRRRQ